MHEEDCHHRRFQPSKSYISFFVTVIWNLVFTNISGGFSIMITLPVNTWLLLLPDSEHSTRQGQLKWQFHYTIDVSLVANFKQGKGNWNVNYLKYNQYLPSWERSTRRSTDDRIIMKELAKSIHYHLQGAPLCFSCSGESKVWFLSDPGPIIVYACQSLTDSLTDSLTTFWNWCHDLVEMQTMQTMQTM